MIQGDYILVAGKTIMPCDTKRAKRYKPSLTLKHRHHGKRHDKEITWIIMTESDPSGKHTVHHDKRKQDNHDHNYIHSPNKVSMSRAIDTYNHTSRVTQS
jgi:hypothetical protein